MDDNGFENDDIEFSIIAPDSDKPKAVDFSVDSLLVEPAHGESGSEDPKRAEQIREVESEPADGSFMRDLGKMEKQISYDSNPYNIYQSSELPMEFTGFNEGKQESTCTKTLNNMTKGGSRFIEPDFKHLILDFKEEKEQADFKIKQNFQDYFGTQTLLTTKLQDHKSKDKLRSRSKKKILVKSPIHTLHDSSKTKKTNLSTVYSVGSFHKASVENVKQKNKKTAQPVIETERTTKTRHSHDRSSSSRSQTKKFTKQLSSHKDKDKTTRNKVTSRKKKTLQCGEIYSEYYGFPSTVLPTSRTFKVTSESKSKSKGKKIVFSKKNVHGKP